MTLVSTESGAAVTLAVVSSVATITFDRVAFRNAIRLRDWLALPGLIANAETDAKVKLIVIRGAGGHFGSGNDIGELRGAHGDPKLGWAFARAMAAAMATVEAATKPVIFAIEGVCYGASVALSLAGDFRVGADNASFAITPAKLGALYLRSDIFRLTAAVGTQAARKLIYTSQPIDAAQAQRIGLIGDVFPVGDFESALRKLIDSIAEGSSSTLRRSKKMLRQAGFGPAPVETDASLSLFVEATQSADFANRTLAFLEKRAPIFL